MSEKLNMSLSGYAKFERGETKLYLDKLKQIVQILDIDVVELIQSGEKNICFQIESPLGSVYQGVGGIIAVDWDWAIEVGTFPC